MPDIAKDSVIDAYEFLWMMEDLYGFETFGEN